MARILPHKAEPIYLNVTVACGQRAVVSFLRVDACVHFDECSIWPHPTTKDDKSFPLVVLRAHLIAFRVEIGSTVGQELVDGEPHPKVVRLLPLGRHKTGLHVGAEFLAPLNVIDLSDPNVPRPQGA